MDLDENKKANMEKEAKIKFLIKKSTFIQILVIEVLFYIYLYYIHNNVIELISDINFIDYEGKVSNAEDMVSPNLALIMLLAVVLEAIGFILISASATEKKIILIISGIPRLLFYWDIARTIHISLFSSLSLTATWLMFFGIPILTIIVLILFFMGDYFRKKIKLLRFFKFGSLSYYLLIMPMYFTWYSYTEIGRFTSLTSDGWFVFFGMYTTFVYLPLKFPYWLAYFNINSFNDIFKMPDFKNNKIKFIMFILLISQPLIVYFYFFKNAYS